MNQEVSSRTCRHVIHYVRRFRPDQVQALLEDLDAGHLNRDHAWASYQDANLLYQRAEKIFRRDDIMVEIGRSLNVYEHLGWAGWIFRLITKVRPAFALAVKRLNRQERTAALQILDHASHQVLIEARCREGCLRTRGACNFTKGFFYAILNHKKVHWANITETQCAVPIWEKGVIDHSLFSLHRGRILRRNLLTDVEEDMGPLAADGTFAFGGTVYGAASCIYEVVWVGYRSLWFKVLDYLFLRPQLFERIQRELLAKYEMAAKQYQQLQRTNQQLASLLKERTELNQTLEDRVAERTRELEYTVERLQALDRTKSDFLSVASHELRIPLTVIKGALSLLVSESDQLGPAVCQKYLHMAHKNCDRLSRLLNELLDLSRLESGSIRLDLKEVDLPQLVRETLDALRTAALSRELDLLAVVTEAMPGLTGDPGRLQRILENLVSNALKFTPPGGRVTVSLRPDGDFAEIIVADTGIGISASEQEAIFSKFYQVDTSLTREAGGVGLGLAIVKELVHMHDGVVWVESEMGVGSRFYVRLPLAGPSRARTASAERQYFDRPSFPGNQP